MPSEHDGRQKLSRIGDSHAFLRLFSAKKGEARKSGSVRPRRRGSPAPIRDERTPDVRRVPEREALNSRVSEATLLQTARELKSGSEIGCALAHSVRM